jgi:hypothetical protein
VCVCVCKCLSVCVCVCVVSVFVSVVCVCVCVCVAGDKADAMSEASHWKSSNCISKSFFRSACGWHVVDAVCDVLAVTAILSVN